MIRNSTPAVAVCDSCGDEAEAIEVRKPRTGVLSAAYLPEHWLRIGAGRDELHLCGDCVSTPGGPFGDRREAFDARLDHHGPAMLAPIAASLGLPDSIAALWCAEWQKQQRSVV